jgi:preprotein translocase subunit SecD
MTAFAMLECLSGRGENLPEENMNRQHRLKALAVIAVVVVVIRQAYPPGEKLILGLDLQGRIQLVLQIDTEKASADSGNDLVDRVTQNHTQPTSCKSGEEH